MGVGAKAAAMPFRSPLSSSRGGGGVMMYLEKNRTADL